MRPLKFRQRVKDHWHYWGVFEDVFVCPENPYDPSYQFTGLFDKNSKEIWEGDIVDAYVCGSPSMKREIKFCEGRFYIEDESLLRTENLLGWRLEVLGNIYENPELLTGEPNGS